MKNMVPIGQFSLLCRLTVKALRHYDKLGLLRPAVIDSESGYRYYSLAQVSEAARIRLLRSLEMPLEEIQELVGETDSEVIQSRLRKHQQRIESKITQFQDVIGSLQRLIHRTDDLMRMEVRVKQLKEQPFLSVRTHTPLSGLSELFGRAMQDLFGHIFGTGNRPAGPPFSIYHDEEFKEEDIDLEICVPTERKLMGREGIDGAVLPAGPAACTLHMGPYGEIGGAYTALAGWIQEHGHQMSGPPREVYLVGPDQARDPMAYRTEVEWPIR